MSTKELTRKDYTIRNKALRVLIAALRYESDDATYTTIRGDILKRIDKAIEAGDIVRTEDGYALTQQMIDRWDANFKKNEA